jgi:hypothetical protein
LIFFLKVKTERTIYIFGQHHVRIRKSAKGRRTRPESHRTGYFHFFFNFNFAIGGGRHRDHDFLAGNRPTIDAPPANGIQMRKTSWIMTKKDWIMKALLVAVVLFVLSIPLLSYSQF